MKNQYPDHNPLYTIKQGYNEATRMLMFHSYPISFSDLEEALELVGRYNNFDPRIAFKILSETFGEDFDYVIGREYSVVIYVIAKRRGFHQLEDLIELKRAIQADEISIENNRLRLWWD